MGCVSVRPESFRCVQRKAPLILLHFFVTHCDLPLLPQVSRQFSVKPHCSTIKVVEEVKNLAGFQRAVGRAQHVTIGDHFLRSGRN